MMKIIGETKTGYIVDISKDEMANIFGYFSGSSTKMRISVGDDVCLSEAYHAYEKILSVMASFKGASELFEKNIDVLKRLADIENCFLEVKKDEHS
jgi:hypothetical protein